METFPYTTDQMTVYDYSDKPLVSIFCCQDQCVEGNVDATYEGFKCETSFNSIPDGFTEITTVQFDRN